VIWKWTIALLIIGTVTGTTIVSAVNVSSTRTIQCIGTIDYTNTRTIHCKGTVACARQTFDLNRDGRVDLIDVAMVARAFGSCVGNATWNPSLDVNDDGKIGEADLSIMVSNCWKE
jgi:hypothetical protein